MGWEEREEEVEENEETVERGAEEAEGWRVGMGGLTRVEGRAGAAGDGDG